MTPNDFTVSAPASASDLVGLPWEERVAGERTCPSYKFPEDINVAGQRTIL